MVGKVRDSGASPPYLLGLTSRPPPEDQVRFIANIERILSEGSFVATYKYALLVALGMTRFWQGSDGRNLDVGPFVAALEFATGVAPVVTGKPAAAFFEAAAHRLGVPADQLAMVGDDIRGDVEGAQRAGMSGVLVRTGKFHLSDLDAGITPHATLESVADLPAWWDRVE